MCYAIQHIAQAAIHAVDLLAFSRQPKRLEEHSDALQERPVRKVEQATELGPQRVLELCRTLAKAATNLTHTTKKKSHHPGVQTKAMSSG